MVSGLGTPSSEPPLVAWSGDTSRAGIGLERTAAEAVRLELATRVEASSVAGQLSRLAFPLGLGGQGVFLDSGYDSLRFSGSGELEPDVGERLDPDRLGGLGRAALRTLSSLDVSGAPRRGPRSYVTAVSQVLPGWVVSVLAFSLLLPAVVASVDAFARARRRGQPVLPGLRRIGLMAAALLGGLLLAKFFTLVNVTPEAPQAAVDPSALPLDGPAAFVLGAVVLATGGLLYLVKRYFGGGARAAPGTACATALVLSGACLALWVLDPYAALIAAPALHLWMLAMLLEPRPRRRLRVMALVGGLVPPAIVALYYSIALAMDPLHGAWYLLMSAMGGTPSLATLLVWVALAASFAAAARSVLVPDPPEEKPPERPSLRAVPSYAGPGSLGGTESAMPRR